MKLYLNEPESPQAGAIAGSASHPIMLSHLTVLELKNALHLNVFQKKITEETRREAWNAFETDLAAGIHSVIPIPTAELYAQAGELADKYSATQGSRSLNLLHVQTS